MHFENSNNFEVSIPLESHSRHRPLSTGLMSQDVDLSPRREIYAQEEL